MKRNSPFYGDSGGGLTTPNNVDISQRTAEGPGGNDFVGKAIAWLRKNPELARHPMLQGGQLEKRLQDEMRAADAGHDSTAAEDARLEQGRPENGQPFPTDRKIMPATHGEDIDEYADQAERMTRDMERTGALNPYGEFAHPQKRMAFVEELAERLRNPNGNGQKKVQPQNPEEEPFSSEEFWSKSNRDEQQRYAKQVRPPKL